MISLHGTLYASKECNCSCVFEILLSQHSQDNQGYHSLILKFHLSLMSNINEYTCSQVHLLLYYYDLFVLNQQKIKKKAWKSYLHRLFQQLI